MDDPLDNDLKKRIGEVFDNYNDEHADEGWLLLREKYPEKARRRAVAWLWWSSAAAVLLLFLGILLINKTPEKENKLAGNKPAINHPVIKSIEPQKDNNVVNNKNADSDKAADSVMNTVQTQLLADNKLSTRAHTNTTSKKAREHLNTSDRMANNTGNKTATANNGAPANNITGQSIAAINPSNISENQPVVMSKADNAAKIDPGINSVTQSLAVTKSNNNGVNMLDQSKQSNKTLFADNEVPKDKKTKTQEYSGRAVRFGIYAATYVNYARGSNNRVNEGLGISSDIRLSRKLNLSTGVAIGQNSLSYGNQLPPEQAKLLAASNASVSSNTLAAEAYSKNGFSAATPSLKNYNASLVGLEVPINLKYQFNPAKSATFVSIGVSSGTFIKETYTSTYNYVTPFASNLSQTTDQSLQQNFNSFYFAKTLNFSFGTGYRIAGNDLIIEPFVKYPIQGMGAQQIKFGSGGVNLKFNFPGRRK
ncbi:hypothetical protein [Mucilaginibacter sp. BT774]|uniref:hypothetical protein n=1 Tax=Mucilaginibacter sp. BT774 TaxID=3062276 RepID=UPI0026760CD0|nr:hypothetical protein [Mucilaginibacter sp. BT774]MDO3626053.1 hypothetical protein [Mucilaginibacter sp. BT774]